MIDLEAIKEACCTTECTAFSLGNCPFWGNSAKLKCNRIKQKIQNGQN